MAYGRLLRSHIAKNWAEFHLSCWGVKPRLQKIFASDGGAISLKIVMSPAHCENKLCSHPRTGDVTAEKITGKNCEKLNELNFSQ